MWAMVVKEFRELVRDRRTMAMLIALPLILLIVFGYAANFSVSSIDTEVVGPRAAQVAAQAKAPFDVQRIDPTRTRAQAVDDLRNNRVDVVIFAPEFPPRVVLIDGSSLFTAQSALGALSAGASVTMIGKTVQSRGFIAQVLFNPQLKTSWVMVPALIGLIMTFIGTIITSLGLVRERQAGTLEQLAVMPFRPSDVIIGKIAPYFLLASADMLVVTIIGCLLFGVPFAGNVVVFAVASAVFLLVVLGLGVLISTLSQNQGQAIQAAILVVLPQVLLSGMIFPLTAMPWGVRWIGYCLPLTYYINISQGVMLRDASLTSLWPSLLVVVAMACVVLGIAILRFRRDLAPNVKAVA
ncbi:MAG TPA: ABC transporter permease [Jatrophihabitantaceae bacterium]|jgi:ABC-2 type transport system permease protein|nr:ABC transporter permease [Jatrophihabitantaceae bacterium]